MDEVVNTVDGGQSQANAHNMKGTVGSDHGAAMAKGDIPKYVEDVAQRGEVTTVTIRSGLNNLSAQLREDAEAAGTDLGPQGGNR